MDNALVEHLRGLIGARGPLSFRDYMDEVLYHPNLGYYSTASSRIGYEGDFYTSSDLDPIFGELLARRFQQMAEQMESFTLVELGAGKGLLAAHILKARSFPYRILERSPAMRARQQELLRDFEVEWIDDLPLNLSGCIFSNEFFDALPVHRLVQRGGRLKEIHVDGDFKEVELDTDIAIEAPLRDGQIVDLSIDARNWIRRIGSSLRQGYHLVIDYGYLHDEFFAQRRGTLMCYRKHRAVESPYENIGEQDMTAHVNFTDLMREGESAGLETREFIDQKSFLIRLGILDEMQRLAAAGNAESMQRLLRMKNLIDPSRMGDRFKVLLQERRDSLLCSGGHRPPLQGKREV